MGEGLGVFGKRVTTTTIASSGLQTTAVGIASVKGEGTEEGSQFAFPRDFNFKAEDALSSNVLRLRGVGPKLKNKPTGDSSDEESSDRKDVAFNLKSEDTQSVNSQTKKYLKEEMINDIYEKCSSVVSDNSFSSSSFSTCVKAGNTFKEEENTEHVEEVQRVIAEKRKEVEAAFARARTAKSKKEWDKAQTAAMEASNYWN